MRELGASSATPGAGSKERFPKLFAVLRVSVPPWFTQLQFRNPPTAAPLIPGGPHGATFQIVDHPPQLLHDRGAEANLGETVVEAAEAGRSLITAAG